MPVWLPLISRWGIHPSSRSCGAVHSRPCIRTASTSLHVSETVTVPELSSEKSLLTVNVRLMAVLVKVQLTGVAFVTATLVQVVSHPSEPSVFKTAATASLEGESS